MSYWFIRDPADANELLDIPEECVFKNRTDLNTALNLWIDGNWVDPSSNMPYGDISIWDVSGVTDMSNLIKQFGTKAHQFYGDLSLWDVRNVTNMSRMFEGATTFTSDLSGWDVSNVTDMRYMFKDATNFNSDINTRSVTDRPVRYSGEFVNAENQKYTKTGTVNYQAWNTKNVKSMEGMFQGAKKFNNEISKWDVSQVTNMSRMFEGAVTFDKSISEWNVSNVTDMSYMFAALLNYTGRGTSNLKYRDGVKTWRKWDGDDWENKEFEETIIFNNSISGWNTENVESMEGMFQGAKKFNNEISKWDVSQVTNMSRMFYGAYSFNQDISMQTINQAGSDEYVAWDVSKVTDMSFMFHGAKDFNKDINNWNIQKVTTFESMFSGVPYIGLYYYGTEPEASQYSYNGDPTVVDIVSAFNQDLTEWGSKIGSDTDINTKINMRNMFRGATSFNGDINTWNLTNVENMSEMFNGASKFNKDIKMKTIKTINQDSSGEYVAWDVSGINIVRMFADCAEFNQDIRNWNIKTTSKQNLFNLFHGTSSLDNVDKRPVLRHGFDNRWTYFKYKITLNDLQKDSISINGESKTRHRVKNNVSNDISNVIGNWDVSEIKNMDGWFYNSKIENHKVGGKYYTNDISHWNVSNVISMNYMFYGASGFQLNISNWDVSNVNAMDGIFYGATKMIERNNVITSEFNTANKGEYFKGRVINNATLRELINNWKKDKTNLEYSDIESLNTEDVTDMSGLFQDISGIDIDIRNWDIRNVTDISGIFTNATFANNVRDKYLKYIRIERNDQTLNHLNDLEYDDRFFVFKSQILYTSRFSDMISELVVRDEDKDRDDPTFFKKKYGPLGNWNIQNVYNMSYAFWGVDFSNQPLLDDISEWDVSHVTDMNNMFNNAKNFNVDYIKNWNVENVTNMNSMFARCKFKINDALQHWNVKNVVDTSRMFDAIDETNIFDTNVVGIENWNTSSVIRANYMFNGAATFNVDISGWNVSNVEFMEGMFMNATSFNSVLSQWNTSNVTNMSNMFKNATSFNSVLSHTSNVTNMSNMFYGAELFNADISGWNVSNVVSMRNMFYGAVLFNADISNWNTKKVIDMSSMFHSAAKFNRDIGKWNTSNVTNMNSMFASTPFNKDISTKTINVGTTDEYTAWDVLNVADMSNMFSGATVFNQPIGNWNTSNVTNMSSMFYLAQNFNQDIGNWTTKNVIDMSNMFKNAWSFDADIGNWNTSYVTNMNSMFASTPSFNKDISTKTINLPTTDEYKAWNVANVTDMSKMFFSSAFNKDISKWNVSNVKDMSSMFKGNMRFIGNLRRWNTSNVTNMNSMFADCSLMNQLDSKTSSDDTVSSYFNEVTTTTINDTTSYNKFIYDGSNAMIKLSYLDPDANLQRVMLEIDDLMPLKRLLVGVKDLSGSIIPITPDRLTALDTDSLYSAIYGNMKLKLLHTDINNNVQSVDMILHKTETETGFLVYNDYLKDTELLKSTNSDVNSWDRRSFYFQMFANQDVSNISDRTSHTYIFHIEASKLNSLHNFTANDNIDDIKRYCLRQHGIHNIDIKQTIESVYSRVYEYTLNIHVYKEIDDWNERYVTAMDKGILIKNFLNNEQSIIAADFQSAFPKGYLSKIIITYKRITMLDNVAMKYEAQIKTILSGVDDTEHDKTGSDADYDTTHPTFIIDEQLTNIVEDASSAVFTTKLDITMNNVVNGTEEEMDALLQTLYDTPLHIDDDTSLFNITKSVETLGRVSVMSSLQNVVLNTSKPTQYNNIKIKPYMSDNIDFKIFTDSADTATMLLTDLSNANVERHSIDTNDNTIINIRSVKDVSIIDLSSIFVYEDPSNEDVEEEEEDDTIDRTGLYTWSNDRVCYTNGKFDIYFQDASSETLSMTKYDVSLFYATPDNYETIFHQETINFINSDSDDTQYLRASSTFPYTRDELYEILQEDVNSSSIVVVYSLANINRAHVSTVAILKSPDTLYQCYIYLWMFIWMIYLDSDYYNALTELDKTNIQELLYKKYISLEEYHFVMMAKYIYPYMDNMIVDSQS